MPNLESLSREELEELVRVLWTEVQQLRSLLEEKEGPLPPGAEATGQVPSWVKPNRPKQAEGSDTPAPERKKRARGFGRRCEEPTESIKHRLENCPDCGHKLAGGWAHSTRQIITVPQVQYQVIEHVMMRHRCGVCGKEWVCKPDLSEEVVGRSRFGIELMAEVAHLATEARMPRETIQSWFSVKHGLHISEGGITGILHRVAALGKSLVEEVLSSLRGGAFVHADETGWRENGRNSYLWSVSRPDCRYYHIDRSRGSAVIEGLLGEEYSGIVVADFYSGYSPLGCLKQRCWVHLLRDVKALRDAHPKNASIAKWSEGIQSLYESAKAYQSEQLALLERDRLAGQEAPNPLGRASGVRARKREEFERALMALVKRYRKHENPRRRLAKRMEGFLPELFLFVECPEVPPENNAAERAIRPAVVARKVSGGTRSPRGSETKAILMTLWGTWRVRGMNPLQACRELLASTPAPQLVSAQRAPTPA